jgi:hypothetical protein
MRFRIEGNPERAEWVCNEIANQVRAKWRSKLIVSAKVERKGGEIIFEVNTRPAYFLNHNETARNMLHVLLMGMLLEEAHGASVEILDEKIENVSK